MLVHVRSHILVYIWDRSLFVGLFQFNLNEIVFNIGCDMTTALNFIDSNDKRLKERLNIFEAGWRMENLFRIKSIHTTALLKERIANQFTRFLF